MLFRLRPPSGYGLVAGFGNARILVIEEKRHRRRKRARPNDGCAQRNMLAFFISRAVIFAGRRLVRIVHAVVVPCRFNDGIDLQEAVPPFALVDDVGNHRIEFLAPALDGANWGNGKSGIWDVQLGGNALLGLATDESQRSQSHIAN
jgi:hypothetical protein